MYIDTHAHLNMPDFLNLEAVLERAKQASVSKIIDVGFDMQSSELSLKLSGEYDNIYSAVGVHPHDAESFNDHELEKLKSLAQNPKVVAIGEIGLDYYRNLSPKESQVKAFISQLNLAQELGLPVIVHARDSYDDVLKIIHEENNGNLKGVMHCFSGDGRIAKLTLDTGFYISFAGTLTFKKADNIRKIAKIVPLDRVLVETDCPYLAPEPFRGRVNEPSFVIHIAKKIAEIRNLDERELAARMKQNAENLFTKIIS